MQYLHSLLKKIEFRLIYFAFFLFFIRVTIENTQQRAVQKAHEAANQLRQREATLEVCIATAQFQ